MKDRSKAIEEMAKIISNSRYKNDDIAPLRGAEALYNAGYRKVNEGDVVLTKEEHKQMLIDFIDYQKISDEIVAERTRKETAREILQEFWNIQFGQTELDNVCIRLAEKYGVEVE